jgi:hypothetical protein
MISGKRLSLPTSKTFINFQKRFQTEDLFKSEESETCTIPTPTVRLFGQVLCQKEEVEEDSPLPEPVKLDDSFDEIICSDDDDEIIVSDDETTPVNL